MSNLTPVFSIDFVAIRKAFTDLMQESLLLDQDHVVFEEDEYVGGVQNRPSLPYASLKITTPAAKYGDDSKDNVKDAKGNLTTKWNSGGPRKMTVSFHFYGRSHEEAYNYGSLWQSVLDTWPAQDDLRQSGVAVWDIGNVADLSQLLNTGYEGRAHLESTFGIAANIQTDSGEVQTVNTQGTVLTDSGVNTTSPSVVGPS